MQTPISTSVDHDHSICREPELLCSDPTGGSFVLLRSFARQMEQFSVDNQDTVSDILNENHQTSVQFFVGCPTVQFLATRSATQCSGCSTWRGAIHPAPGPTLSNFSLQMVRQRWILHHFEEVRHMSSDVFSSSSNLFSRTGLVCSTASRKSPWSMVMSLESRTFDLVDWMF